MRQLVAQEGLARSIEVDSAGTGDWHIGEPADPRAIAAAKRRGFALTDRARQFQVRDWDEFDYVVAMDRSNYDILLDSAPEGVAGEKLFMLRSFDPASPPGAEVPDPYYTRDGFDEVIDLSIAACQGLLDHLRRTRELDA
jgi:protein-tyrosine phosphatase